MSSGESIPYQLRQNKAVDRYAFIELLSKIDRVSNIAQYTYIGFGGHSLEDFKHIHAQFGNRSMVSIEQDENVHQRQRFNQPHSCIERRLTSSSSFIEKFPNMDDLPNLDKVIFWLDYVSPKELRIQIEEFQSLISKLNHLDIIKITLNANPSAYATIPEGISEDERNERRMEALRDALGSELFPASAVDSEMMVRRKFPTALCKVLEMAAAFAISPRPDLSIFPLTLFSYADGQQMLTVTVILLEKTNLISFLNHTGIKDWELYGSLWNSPREINIPSLTMRERLKIDSLLPEASPEKIHQELGFKFDKNENTSLRMLKNYALFYRQSPFFSKVFV